MLCWSRSEARHATQITRAGSTPQSQLFHGTPVAHFRSGPPTQPAKSPNATCTHGVWAQVSVFPETSHQNTPTCQRRPPVEAGCPAIVTSPRPASQKSIKPPFPSWRGGGERSLRIPFTSLCVLHCVVSPSRCLPRCLGDLLCCGRGGELTTRRSPTRVVPHAIVVILATFCVNISHSCDRRTAIYGNHWPNAHVVKLSFCIDKSASIKAIVISERLHVSERACSTQGSQCRRPRSTVVQKDKKNA